MDSNIEQNESVEDRKDIRNLSDGQLSTQATIAFLYNAIEDTRDIIRVIDIKISTIMLINTIPIAKLGVVLECCKSIFSEAYYWGAILTVIFVSAWTLAVYTSIHALAYTMIPKSMISGTIPKAVFYRNPKLSKRLLILNPQKAGNINLDRALAKVLYSQTEIRESLVYEHLKLSVIREIKAQKLKVVVISIFVWTLCGFAIWIKTNI